MSEKHKSILPRAIQVKRWWKTISTEEKLNEINQHEKGEQIVDTCYNVMFAHSSVCTILDKADKITESAKWKTKVFVYQDYHSPIGMYFIKKYASESLAFLLHWK